MAVVVVVIMALLLVAPRIVGLQVYTVLSGSMEPHYHVGSIIYTKKVDPATLEVGDAISFLLAENTVATHRIIEVLPDENNPDVYRFRTKGDNNDIPDTTPVHCNNVLGKVVGTVPLLGYVSNFVQNPPGTYITLGVAIVLILAVFVPDIISKAKAVKEEEAEKSVSEQPQIDNAQLKAELEALKVKIAETKKKEGNDNEENV